MVKERKRELIASFIRMGLPTRKIAWLVYRDRTERAQRRVRAFYYYLKRKGLLSGTIKKPPRDNKYAEMMDKLRCMERRWKSLR